MRNGILGDEELAREGVRLLRLLARDRVRERRRDRAFATFWASLISNVVVIGGSLLIGFACGLRY